MMVKIIVAIFISVWHYIFVVIISGWFGGSVRLVIIWMGCEGCGYLGWLAFGDQY